MPLLNKTGKNYSKYNMFVEELIKTSMSKRIPILYGTSKVRHVLRRTNANKDALTRYLRESMTNQRAPLNKIMLETTEKKKISFGEINSVSFKAAPNKGDVAEGIFAASIYARFLSKTKKINIRDVQDILKKADKRKRKTGNTIRLTLKEKSANKNGIVFDDISLNIILAETNMNSLLDEDIWTPELKNLFDLSIKYANSKTVKDWADLLYCNNQYNSIEVVADGTEDQSSTKVDVRVIIDKSNVDINVSLKIGNVKQFGQISGSDFNILEKMWKRLGVNISPKRKKYYDLLGKKETIKAFALIYETVVQKKQIETKHFNDFIVQNATLKEKNVSLIQLGTKVKIYDFNKLKKITNEKIEMKQKKDSFGKPLIIFHIGKQELLQIRMKIENRVKGVYVRNYVEKLKGLEEILASTI